MKYQKFWLGVVSKEHVMIGTKKGFAQVCHGKEKPLKRLSKGDVFIYYSPKINFKKAEPYQCFTAFGIVKDHIPYQVEQTEIFHPYRRDIEYIPMADAPIKPLIPKLSFIHNKERWGYSFRFGLVEISRDDVILIATAMNISKDKLNEVII